MNEAKASFEDSVATLKDHGGFDLQYRKFHQGWSAPWRARLRPTYEINKHLRLYSFGSTLEEAVALLIAAMTAAKFCA